MAAPWVRAVDDRARARLFCLPYAGGGTAEYRAWADALPGTVDLCPVVLPGREGRLGESPVAAMAPLIEGLADALGPLWRRAPYAIYGHSMGAWIGFELAREARRRGLPLPQHLIVGARRAPDRPDPLPPLSGLADDAFVAAIQNRYAAIPAPILDHPEILALFLPTLRADFTLLETYRYTEEPPLAVPITAVRGTEDGLVSEVDVRAWARHTTGGFDMRAIFSGHFFVRDRGLDAADLVGEIVSSAFR